MKKAKEWAQTIAENQATDCFNGTPNLSVTLTIRQIQLDAMKEGRWRAINNEAILVEDMFNAAEDRRQDGLMEAMEIKKEIEKGMDL